MNLHEYQAKELLKKYNLPLLNGKVYFNECKGIDLDLNKLKGPPWVIKSQIHAGGRGAGYFKETVNNKGGVQVIFDKEKVTAVAQSMMGNTLITKQTGKNGKKVNRIFIEEGCIIEREFYLSLLIDRNNSQLMMMISSEGGVDIEEVAETSPENIHYIHFNNFDKIILPLILQKDLNISNDEFLQLEQIASKLVKAFVSLDATSIEINPLVLSKDSGFILLDAKVSIDDNALFYLTSRGIPIAEAQDMLVLAFLNEAIDEITGDDIKEIIANRLKDWMVKRHKL